eukprot:2417022-Rhodomonas_salina.2
MYRRYRYYRNVSDKIILGFAQVGRLGRRLGGAASILRLRQTQQAFSCLQVPLATMMPMPLVACVTTRRSVPALCPILSQHMRCSTFSIQKLSRWHATYPDVLCDAQYRPGCAMQHVMQKRAV